MADAGSALTAGAPPLRVLAFAPLPFLRDGRPTFCNGGTNFYAALLPRLAGRGHHTMVIADAPAPSAGERRTGLAWDVPNLAVEWFAYEHRSSQLRPTPEYRQHTAARVCELIERQARQARPDVVLFGREMVRVYAGDLCEQLGLATVVIAHGPTVAALVAGTYPEALRRELIARLHRTGEVVAVAEHVARGLESVGVTRVTTIRNVTDPVRFRPTPRDPALLRALGLAPDATVVGHVSVMRPWKRLLDIVDSAAIVLPAEPSCVYLIVGDGPCRSAAEERARGLGLAARFRFTGEVAHEEVPRYLALMDVVLQPSEREGYPLVYREAQACGRALLASDIPPAREAIVPGETGMLFRTGAIDDLAATTLVLVRDPALRARLGARARALAVAEPIESWIDAYELVLRRAVAQPSAATR